MKDLWILEQEIPVDWGLTDNGQELVGEPNLNSHYANEHFSLKISKMFYFFRIHWVGAKSVRLGNKRNKGHVYCKRLVCNKCQKDMIWPICKSIFSSIAHFIEFELMHHYFQFFILLVDKLLWRRKCFRGEAHQWTGLFSLTNSRTLSLRVGCNSYFFPITHQYSFAKKILLKLSIICIFWHIFTSSSSLFVFLFGWLSIFVIDLSILLSALSSYLFYCSFLSLMFGCLSLFSLILCCLDRCLSLVVWMSIFVVRVYCLCRLVLSFVRLESISMVCHSTKGPILIHSLPIIWW